MQRDRPVDAAVRRPVRRTGKRRPSPTKASFGARLLHEAIPLVPAAVIGAGLTFHGFNTIAGKAVCCLLAALCLVALVLARWPEKAFWWRLAPVLLLTGLPTDTFLTHAATISRRGADPSPARGVRCGLAAGRAPRHGRG